ncbi:hypothetical protein L1987_60314 [Smallanthus sonchifolius]|uniref:Uncharacterized protein n=1 Tax=Smallanthus sonchifolius TaxID=185202 RepID=A0ACB9D844_9ASTR|nr:hypothetical protein L1987_60314 [Smallanthus sonchifolius]
MSLSPTHVPNMPQRALAVVGLSLETLIPILHTLLSSSSHAIFKPSSLPTAACRLPPPYRPSHADLIVSLNGCSVLPCDHHIERRSERFMVYELVRLKMSMMYDLVGRMTKQKKVSVVVRLDC